MNFRKWALYRKAYSGNPLWPAVLVLRRPRFKEIAVRAAQLSARGWVLDIGTGPAYLPMEITDACPNVNVIGVDISLDLLGDAHNRNKTNKVGERISLVSAMAESLPFADDAFETVTSMFSFHLWSNRQQGINEIERVLKPGRGALILVGRYLLLHGFFSKIKDDFTKRSIRNLESLCLNAGFEKVTVKDKDGILYVSVRKSGLASTSDKSYQERHTC